MRRRTVAVLAATVLVAGVLAALWPGGQPAEGAIAPARVRLVLQWKPQAQFAGYYMAVQKGYYRERGLDVTIIPGGPAVDPMALLQSGDAEFATNFLTGAMTASEMGKPIVDICQVVNRSSLMLIARRSEIKDRDDLDRRRVTLWGSSFRSAYIGYFNTAGVRPILLPQYYTVNLFLRGGAAACAAMEYNEYETIIESGMDPGELTLIRLREVGFGFPEDGVYTLASTQQRSPAMSAAFAEATLQGWDYVRTHRDEAVSMVMRYTLAAHVPTNRVHQRWMLDHVLRAIYPEKGDTWKVGVLSRVDYERTRAIMIGERQIKRAPPYREFVAPEARGVP